jgi:hypothetical protein
LKKNILFVWVLHIKYDGIFQFHFCNHLSISMAFSPGSFSASSSPQAIPSPYISSEEYVQAPPPLSGNLIGNAQFDFRKSQQNVGAVPSKRLPTTSLQSQPGLHQHQFYRPPPVSQSSHQAPPRQSSGHGYDYLGNTSASSFGINRNTTDTSSLLHDNSFHVTHQQFGDSVRSGRSVKVFGFGPSSLTTILEKFQQIGDIKRYEYKERGNWVVIEYSNTLHASKALAMNGKEIVRGCMIGVVWDSVLEETGPAISGKGAEAFTNQGSYAVEKLEYSWLFTWLLHIREYLF